MPRAFVGIFLSEQTRRTVSAEMDRLRPLSRAVAWVAPNNLHVTLRFLGDQTEEQRDENAHTEPPQKVIHPRKDFDGLENNDADLIVTDSGHFGFAGGPSEERTSDRSPENRPRP